MIASALLARMLMGGHAVGGVCYGGMVAMANTLLLGYRMKLSAKLPGRRPAQEVRSLYYSSMERFFVVVLLIAAGLGWLKLLPAALLTGFVLGQVALVVSTIMSGIEKR